MSECLSTYYAFGELQLLFLLSIHYKTEVIISIVNCYFCRTWAMLFLPYTGNAVLAVHFHCRSCRTSLIPYLPYICNAISAIHV